jgi:hypothetical protein
MRQIDQFGAPLAITAKNLTAAPNGYVRAPVSLVITGCDAVCPTVNVGS